MIAQQPQPSTSKSTVGSIHKNGALVLPRSCSKDTLSTVDDEGIVADLDATDAETDWEAGWTHVSVQGDEEQKQIDDLERRLCLAGDDLVRALAKVLEHLCATSGEGKGTPFHSISVPPVSILSYLARIHKYSQCSDACLVLALVFIDRLVKMRPEFKVSKPCVHRLVATCVLMAIKVHDDIYYSNAYYGRVMGIRTSELNKLESCLLGLVGWKVSVSVEEFEYYLGVIMPFVSAV
jgi:hypothetical protein